MMKNLIILLMIVTCVLANKHSKDSNERQNRRKFDNHLKRYGKKYKDLPEEVRARRRNNYLKNLDFIEKHNKNPKNKFQLGSNEFSDRDPKTFVKEMCRTELPQMTRGLPLPPSIYTSTTPARSTVDWRTQYTQPIVSQGGCASCSAFSVVSVIEAYNEIRGRGKTAMSQQNIVDCHSVKCLGGWPKSIFDWLKNTYGNKLARATDYPYTSGRTKTAGSCKVAQYVPLNYTSTFLFVPNGNTATLKQIISNYGPVAIAVQVTNSGLFQNYKSGIFTDATCPGPNQCTIINHAMVAVGYGKLTTGQEYFIIRNSWGTTWGENGYIRMAMSNTCNVACYAMGIE
ncbi:hypothetical protein ACKWTF_003196 [Chironomus riparius]